MKKRMVYLAVLLLVCLSTLPASAAQQTFTDVPKDSWSAPYVYDLVDRGIVSGYGDGTFGPENTVERGEYAKMLVGISNLPLSTSRVSPYVDVPSNQWYFPYVNSCLRYITGYSTDSGLYFRPEWEASREDVAAALVKVQGLNTSAFADPTAYLSARFSDVDSISTHNRPYVAAAVAKGYLTGDQEGTFRGKDPIIRAEVAAILCRAFPKK